MKSLAIFLLVILKTSFVLADSAPDSFVRFSIDRKIYDNFSDAQKNDLLVKNQDLMNFIESDIRNNIPQNIQRKIKDLKIKISLTQVPGRDGLFVPSEQGEHTIFIQLIQLGSNGIKALLAHEIYHAIQYHLNPNEEPWVREGLAQLFEFIVTQELNGMNLQAAIENPLTPLIGKYDIDNAHPEQYGHDMLYFFYLYNQCGGKDFFWKITQGSGETKLRGAPLIDHVLGKLNYPHAQCRNFLTSALHFEVAKIHNKTQFSSANDQQRYYIFSGNIKPLFKKMTSPEEFKETIEKLPSLSSFQISLEDYLKFQMTFSDCTVFYLQENFPYEVSKTPPASVENTTVVLVKMPPSTMK